MFNDFKTYILKKIILEDEEVAYIDSLARIKRLRKKQYLLQEGDVCKYHAFVTKGLLRTYAVDDKGLEHIIRFAMENWWINDRESLLSGEPSRFNIDAIEDSEVILFEKSDFNLICQNIPSFDKMVNDILNKSFVVSQNRIHEAISTTSEEKYLNFVKRYPEFALRVPQGMIAAYLGIAAETLSRLRSKRA